MEGTGEMSGTTATPYKRVLKVDNLPRRLIRMEYAVRGAVILRAAEIKKDLADPMLAPKWPFKEIIPANIGNPQAVGQLPVTFTRQVLACLLNPSLIGSPDGDDADSNSDHPRKPRQSFDSFQSDDREPPDIRVSDIARLPADTSNKKQPEDALNPTPSMAMTECCVQSPTAGSPSSDTSPSVSALQKSYQLTGRNSDGSLSDRSLTVSPHSSISVVSLPSGVGNIFPIDVRRRAHRYLLHFPSFGAYTHTQGIPLFRHLIAKWFHRRDGHPCDPASIYLTDGASAAIRNSLELLVGGPQDGVLIPVPQYPLYSASITRLSGTAIPYILREERGWQIDIEYLERVTKEARWNGTTVRVLCVINPCNPCGSLISEEDAISVVRFCEKEHIVLFADEVYQLNIYEEGRKFVSFRKLVLDLKASVQLISFHSSSKGLFGECGIRGGLLQAENFHHEVMATLFKLSSVSLCANSIGQAMITTILTPPRETDPSYPQYVSETMAVYDSLKLKAKKAYEVLNSLTGVSCQKIQGAMYAFPRITIPQKALNAAKQKGIEPDLLYCMELLEEKGIACVPGSGFGQEEGTYHFRTTILPKEPKFSEMLKGIGDFHEQFLQRYA